MKDEWTQELNEYQKSKAIDKCPTPLEYLSYLFGLGSLLAGPYFEFSDYKNYIEKKDVLKTNFGTIKIIQ